MKQERYVFRFANVRNSSAWGRNYKIRPEARFFDQGPLLPSVYLGRQNVFPMINGPSPPPSVSSDQKVDSEEGLSRK